MQVNNKTMCSRKTALIQWLGTLQQQYKLDLSSISNASSDASFRSYYRIATASGTVIAMDSPPSQENTQLFINVTQILTEANIHVPSILEQDVKQGFLLISDLGNKTYYQTIQNGLEDQQLQTIYRDAIKSLVKIQQNAQTDNLPQYDAQRLLDELTVFNDWYAAQYKQVILNEQDLQTLQTCFTTLVNHNTSVANVFVHRDYHSPNLIVCDPSINPGVIDYQDALNGPITYDIASLVMDARTTWEEDQQLDWAIRYWEAAKAAQLPIHADFADFHVAYEWMGLQRNLRILGVFARLSIRDNKHQYLDHIPRVNSYVRQVANRYGVFGPLLRVLDKIDNVPVTVGYTF